MKNKIIILLILIVGISFIIYPIISRKFSKINQEKTIEDYMNRINDISNQEKDKDIIEKSYVNFLKSEDILGYIEIPKIKVNLPIYEGTKKDVLSKGIGHVENTQLPTQDLNTHSMLAGHTGYTHAKLFDDLDKLQIDDEFYIYILNKKLEYKVDQIKIVEANYQEELYVDEENSFVTLVTCTPQILNTKRLLVRGCIK